jgi:hypothetical protein
MNDHWNVLYQVSVFYADRKSKMAATAGHMGIMFQNGSSLKPLGPEGHPRNIPAKFGSNWPSGFGEA